MNAVNKIEQHNPIGTDGFEFVEYTASTPGGIQQRRELFTAMGFTETAKHRSKEGWLFQQHDINVVLNGSPTGHVRAFGLKHGPSACAMAFRLENAAQVAAYVESQGATLVGSHANFGELNIPCVEGIGGSLLYLVDRYGDKSIYDVDFEYIEGCTPNDNSVGLKALDHLTHNVKRGQMDVWSGFYQRIAGFREIRYFDIEGKLTGLLSRAMAARCASLDAFKQAAPYMQPDAQSIRPAPLGSGDLADDYWRSFAIDHAAVMTLSDRVASVGNRLNRGYGTPLPSGALLSSSAQASNGICTSGCQMRDHSSCRREKSPREVGTRWMSSCTRHWPFSRVAKSKRKGWKPVMPKRISVTTNCSPNWS
jgi:hypothetical protein